MYIDVTAISVELLVLKPNCESERIWFLFLNFIIFSAMIFSNIFENIGSREIGQKSFIEFGEELLGIGMIAAVSKLSGNDF